MFLAGLEFFLGLVCGSLVVFGLFIVVMVVAERVTRWKRKDAKACIPPVLIEEPKNAVLRRSGVLVVVRASEWKAKSTNRTDRRTRSTY